jgi:hypothetical protein
MSWINDEYQKLDRSRRALRRFGVTIGIAALALGSFLLWRHNRGAGWPLISVGAFLLLVAGFAPTTLKWVHRPWMMLALALGWCMTRILLTIIFFLVVTPIGLLQRIFGKRVVQTAFKTDDASYWQSKKTGRPVPADYEKQF